MKERMRVLSYRILELTKALAESDNSIFSVTLAQWIIADSVELAKLTQQANSQETERKAA